MKGDMLVLGLLESQAQLFAAPPCERGQISCDLASESGVQVLRKGNLDLIEQTSSTGAVQVPHVSPTSSSMATPKGDGKALCHTTHHTCSLYDYGAEKKKCGVFTEKSI